MSGYISRTYEDRKRIQKMWEAGSPVTEIAGTLSAPTTSIYNELRRGMDGTRLPNKRMRYDADLAQTRLQLAFERRGRKGKKGTDKNEQL